MRKRLVGGTPNFHLAPFQYPWAFEFIKNSISNTWGPYDIAMGSDRACYEQRLTGDERHMFNAVFATLTTSDVAIQLNLARLLEHFTACEIQAYMIKQAGEEVIHSVTYQHCIEVLGLDQDDVYGMYQRVPAIAQKFTHAAKYSAVLCNPSMCSPHELLSALIFYYGMFEGVWFYGGFTPIFSLQNRVVTGQFGAGLMTGTGEQLQYIMRDEAQHVAFGVRLIREFMREEKLVLTEKTVHSIVDGAVQAEAEYARYAMPAILGYNAGIHIQQAKFLADRRLAQLGYKPLYGVECAVPWLDSQVNIKKEKNFFETRVIEYQAAPQLEFESSCIDELMNWRAVQ